MAILQKFFEHPMQGIVWLIGTVFISILGAYLKDKILIFLSHFSNVLKNRKQKQEEKERNQAELIQSNTNLLIFFGIKLFINYMVMMAWLVMVVLVSAAFIYGVKNKAFGFNGTLSELYLSEGIGSNFIILTIIFLLYALTMAIMYYCARNTLKISRILDLAKGIQEEKQRECL